MYLAEKIKYEYIFITILTIYYGLRGLKIDILIHIDY